VCGLNIEPQPMVVNVLVKVGSANPAKVKAVGRAFKRFFDGVVVKGAGVESGVAAQPTSLQKTFEGARNRALAAFSRGRCDYAVGVEAGLFSFPSNTGFLETTVCVVFDGKKFYYGMSPSFEYPPHVTKRALSGEEIGAIFDEITGQKDVKKKHGALGVISGGKYCRGEFIEQGVVMALLPIAGKELYGRQMI